MSKTAWNYNGPRRKVGVWYAFRLRSRKAFLINREPIELAKYKPPAMRVRGECYTKITFSR